MATYPHPVPVHRPHVNASLLVIVALAAALIGLAAWVVVDRTTGTSSATSDATTLIDNLFGDVSAGNVASASALFTSDAVVWQSGSTQATGMAQIRKQIAGAKPSGFTITRTAPVSVRGDIAVTQSNAAASVAGMHWRGIDVFQLRNGKIAREWDFEFGATAPFDNAVPTG